LELTEAIQKRRSVRNFKNQPLPENTLEKLIDAARMAPSAGNLQVCEYVTVSKPETKQALSIAARGQIQVAQASVVIVVCVNQKTAEKYGKRGVDLYSILDAGAAIENLMLTAVSLGLGTCWIGAFQEEETAKIIHAPKGIRPVALVPVGYPQDSLPSRPAKRSVNEILQRETF
jgi:nitroreductase